MKVFSIQHDPKFASIVAHDNSSATDLSNLSADDIHEFVSPGFRLNEPEKPLGNFYFLNDTALVFDKVADEAMGNFIEAAGAGNTGPLQLFDIEVDGVGTLYLLNVVEECNALNRNESQIVKGSWKETLALNRLVFHSQRIYSYSSLFKIHDLDYGPILTFTEKENQEHDFIRTYHEAGLAGLVFRELWSD
jgi:hypothetical protein